MISRALRTIIIAVIVPTALVFALWSPVRGQEMAQPCGFNSEAALTWMKTLQNDDGGFTNGFAPESDFGATADAILAIAAAGQDPAGFDAKSGKDPNDYLIAQIEAKKASNVGLLGKAFAAAIAQKMPMSDLWLTSVAQPLSEALTHELDDTGNFGQALGILALAQAGEDVPPSAIERLINAQDQGGGWGFKPGDAPDTNTTALVIRALYAAEQPAPTKAAFDYLRSIQNGDKGWPYQKPSQFATDSDANSTALVIQAILAGGQSLEDWGNPHELLKTFQQADGSFTYQTGQPAPSFLATVAVIPALCEVALREAEPAK